MSINSGRDHNFTPKQKREYDSLPARGRTAYDNMRWDYERSHEEAFYTAKLCYGLKEKR